MEVREEVISYEARGLGAAVAVVNADVGGGGRSKDLALVFE